MKYLISLFLALGGCSLLHAQGTQQFVQEFFTKYSSEPTAAVQWLYSANPWISLESESTQKVVRSIESLDSSLVGRFLGYELISTKKVSDRILIHSCVVLYERQPLRFNFVFYRPRDSWFIYSFTLDDGLISELTEASKLYFID